MSAAPYKTTVTSAAASFDLTLLATVKSELGITNADHDADIDRWIDQASQTAATYCNRTFAQQTYQGTWRLQEEARRTDMLVLPHFPVASITTVVEDGVTLTAADYEFEAETGFLWRLRSDERTCWAAAKVVVTFVAGYQLLDQLPHDVERAVIVMVKQNYFAKARDPLVSEIEIEGVSRRKYWVGSVPGDDNGALPAEVEALLNPYRIIPI